MKNLKLILAGVVVALSLSQTAFAVSYPGDEAVAARSAAQAVVDNIKHTTGYEGRVLGHGELQDENAVTPGLSVLVALPIGEIEQSDGKLTTKGKATVKHLQEVANTLSGMTVYLPRDMIKGETIGEIKPTVDFMANLREVAPDMSIVIADDSGHSNQMFVRIYMEGEYARSTILPAKN